MHKEALERVVLPVVLRFSIVLRGKLLNSALNSLHNFDRSLDKFLAWLSEAESSMESVEVEADRAGTRRDESATRHFSKQLKVSHLVIFVL